MRKFNLDLNLAPAAKAIAEAMSTFHPFEDYLERTDRILAALAKADLVIVPKPVGNAEAVREAAPADEAPVTLVPGNVVTLPPGTDVRAADASAPERDNVGLCPRSADDMAERFGCRVEVSGMDEADTPLTDEFCEVSFVVLTERATGRVVGLVQAWETEDGDPIVPKRWLEIVLGAWDAARDPQQAA